MEELLRFLKLLDTCETVSETKIPGQVLLVPTAPRPASDTSPAAHAVRQNLHGKYQVVESGTLATVVFLKDAIKLLRTIRVLACDACESATRGAFAMFLPSPALLTSSSSLSLYPTPCCLFSSRP